MHFIGICRFAGSVGRIYHGFIKDKEVQKMLKAKLKFTHDEIRVIVLALIELKNHLIQEGRYTDAVDDILIKLVD